MVIQIDAELEAALNAAAKKRGLPPNVLAINALNEQFLNGLPPVQPQDEWERRLLSLAKDCGVSLTDSAVSSEGIYD